MIGIPLNRILKNPCPSNAIPIITTIAPVTLLIHRIVLILNFLRNRLMSHDSPNHHTTVPALTDRMIGATFHVWGASSVSPKKANRVKSTNMAIGLERPIATDFPKSLGDTEEYPSPYFLLKGSENAMLIPSRISTTPPANRIIF